MVTVCSKARKALSSAIISLMKSRVAVQSWQIKRKFFRSSGLSCSRHWFLIVSSFVSSRTAVVGATRNLTKTHCSLRLPWLLFDVQSARAVKLNQLPSATGVLTLRSRHAPSVAHPTFPASPFPPPPICASSVVAMLKSRQ